MRRLTVFIGLLFLVLNTAGCVNLGGHGPVSAGTVRKLQSRAISRDEFVRRLKGVDLETRQSFPLQRVVIPFVLNSNTPVIKAAGPEDQPLTMLLDTGAARMVLGASTANKLRIPTIKASEAQSMMIGVVGNEAGLVGLVSPLRVATWTLPTYPCFVRTHESFGDGIYYPSNILGFDLLARYCSYVTIDYPKKQATLAFRERFKPAHSQSSSAPFRIKHDVPFIELKSKGVTWSSLIDTGSFNGVEIDEAIAKKLGVQDQGKIVEGLTLVAVGGMVSSDKARLRTVTLPEIRLLGGSHKDAEVDISPGIPRVGSFYLKDYRVTFDFRQKRVWLEW